MIFREEIAVIVVNLGRDREFEDCRSLLDLPCNYLTAAHRPESPKLEPFSASVGMGTPDRPNKLQSRRMFSDA